jgi:hypothetical protein
MTGAEQYLEAEKWITRAMETDPPEQRDTALLCAQVHATLAHAAATAVRAIEAGMPSAEYDSWSKAILESRRSSQ